MPWRWPQRWSFNGCRYGSRALIVSFLMRSFCMLVCDGKECSKRQINQTCHENQAGYATLSIENQDRQSVTKFFDHRRDHQRPIPLRVAGDDQEAYLPCDCHANESVIILRMINGRREVQAIPGFQKILWKQDEQPVNPCKQVNP